METINAQSIINEVTAAAETIKHAAELAGFGYAPEKITPAEIKKDAEFSALTKRAKGYPWGFELEHHAETEIMDVKAYTSALDTFSQLPEIEVQHRWELVRMAFEADAELLQDVPDLCGPEFVTIQTSARGHAKIKNTAGNLLAFAAKVRSNAAAFGGGLVRTIKARAAIVWPAKSVSLFKQLIEDHDYSAALDLAESKLGALFCINKNGRALLQVAPVPVDAMPGMVSVMNEGGDFSIIEPVSMRCIPGACKRTRNAQIEAGQRHYDTATPESKARILSEAESMRVDQAACRAQWMAEHAIDDAQEIQTRIDAQAAQDVAQVVAGAQAMAAIEQASESSALQELASDTTETNNTSTEQAARHSDDVQELAIVGELAQQANQQAPGAPGGNMGHTSTTSTTNTSSARQVASSTRAQAINSKSGAWNASFFAGDDGRPCLIFNGGQVLGFDTGSERMRALQAMARQADAAAAQDAAARQVAPDDTPPGGQSVNDASPITKLSDGTVVLAKSGKYGIHACTYANRTQAEQAAEKHGGEVVQRGRPFFVRVCATPPASQAPEQTGAVLKSETPQDQAQALKDTDPAKLTGQQLRSIGSALMSEVDADSLSMATVQRWTPAMFAGAVEYLEDINYHSEALFLECMRAGRDDLAAVIAHLVRYQRAPEYRGLTGDYCEARQVVAWTLKGDAIERVSPEAAAVLAGWGFQPGAVLKSETPQDQSPAFETVKPFNCDPATMLAKGIKPEQLVGMGVNYTGNMATPDGEGAITEVIDTRGERLGSLRLVVLLEDGRRVMGERHYFTEQLRPILQFNGKMHGAPYLAQLAATVATVKAQASAAKEEAARAHAAALVDLVAQYPQLQRADSTYAGGKLAAVNMRTLLKMTFPGHKFSVTSSYNSARICWTDGATDAEVRAVIGRFDIGASDSQSDYFYTVRTAWSDLFGGVQYLTTSRHTSSELDGLALCALYPDSTTRPTVQDYEDGTGVFDWRNHGDSVRRMMREQLAKMSTYQAPAPKTRARA